MLQTHGRAFVCRHPWWAYVTMIVLAALLAENVGSRIVYQWTPINEWYLDVQRTALASVPSDTPYEQVRVIGFSEQTLGKLDQLAATFGVGGLDFSQRSTLRLLHRVLVERLTAADIRALVFDFSFARPSPGDSGLAKAIAALQARGVKTVFGALLDEDGRMIASPALTEGATPGWPLARTSTAQVSLELFVRQAQSEPLPSIAVAGFAAAIQPGADFFITVDPVQALVTLHFFRPDPVVQSRRIFVERTQEIRCSTMEPFDPNRLNQDEPAHGVVKDDLIGLYDILLPSDQALRDSTIEYAWVLSATDEELRSAFANKVVVVGFTCSEGEDLLPNLGDRKVFPVYTHATGIEGLLRAQSWQSERSLNAWVILAGSAFIGAFVPFMLRRRRGTREGAVNFPLFLLLAMVAIVVYLSASALCYTRLHYEFDPFVPMGGLMLATLGAFHIQRVRWAHLR
jgi:CHASE2 domain-containing sensor protein